MIYAALSPSSTSRMGSANLRKRAFVVPMPVFCRPGRTESMIVALSSELAFERVRPRATPASSALVCVIFLRTYALRPDMLSKMVVLPVSGVEWSWCYLCRDLFM